MADLVNLTIDDKKIAVAKGTLIVEAAKSAGIDIPVFCYHPKMKPVGACRMCLVEVGGPKRNPDGTFATNPDGTPVIAMMPKLQTACTTPVSEGMLVRTGSAQVLKAQKGILEFLLINHPLDCPVCDKGGECPLQDQTFRYGPGASRFAPQDKQNFIKPIDLSERIALDRERCIMCFRCVRFQDEIAGDPQIDVFQRGARSEIAVVPGHAFDSNFSGNTIEICPVGALTSKEFRFRARAWEMINVPSVCSLCAVGCNVTLQVRSNKVLRILARDNEAVNEVWICDRGRFGYEYLNENRLTVPLVRQGDGMEKVSWPQAQDSAVAALQQVIKEHGAQAVGGLASPRLANEDLYAFQKFMRAVVGSNNVDYRTWGGAGARGSFTSAIADLESAQGLFVIGADVFADLPILGLRLRKAAVQRHATLIVAYPQPAKLARDASAWLRHTPGQELVLVQALLASLRGAPSSELCDRAGMAQAQVDNATKLLAGRAPSAILYGERLGEREHGRDIVAALSEMAAFLGATVHSLSAEANAQGALDMGVTPGMLPGARPVSDAAARQEVAALWGVASLPEAPGLTGTEMLQAAADGALKALFLAGSDALAGADEDLVERALRNLAVLIVQDMTPTPASAAATAVLPAFSVAESEGTYTNIEHRVQRLRCALQPDGEMRAGWHIVTDLAARLSSPVWNYASAADVFAEITKVVPAYAGLTYAALGAGGRRLG